MQRRRTGQLSAPSLLTCPSWPRSRACCRRSRTQRRLRHPRDRATPVVWPCVNSFWASFRSRPTLSTECHPKGHSAPDECLIHQVTLLEGVSVLKHSLVPISDPCSRALNPGFVVLWAGFQMFCSCFKAVVNEVDLPLRYLPLSITQEASGHPARWPRTQKRAGVQYHCTAHCYRTERKRTGGHGQTRIADIEGQLAIEDVEPLVLVGMDVPGRPCPGGRRCRPGRRLQQCRPYLS